MMCINDFRQPNGCFFVGASGMNDKDLKLVIWEDAFGCPSGWECADEIEKGTSIVHSVGFVIDETDGTLTIAPHIAGQNRENRQFAGVITLPKRQVISVFSCRVFG